MDLIERYIYAVTTHLPESSKEEVAHDLRKRIDEKLPQNATKEEVNAVLLEIGSPWEVAEEYLPEKNHVIGPSFYRFYVWVLKLVLAISISLTLFFTGLDWFLSSGDAPIDFVADITTLIIRLFSSALNTGIQAAFWVTVSFVLLERSGLSAKELSFEPKDWSPADLPEVAASDKAKIPRSDTVFEVIFLIIFAFIFFYRPEWMGMYTNLGGATPQPITFFNLGQLQIYLPFILVILVADLILAIWKLVWGRWHKSLAITNLIVNMVSVVLILFMSQDYLLLNNAFFVRVLQIFDIQTISSSELQTMFTRGAVVAIVLITIFDSAPPFFKLNQKLPTDEGSM